MPERPSRSRGSGSGRPVARDPVVTVRLDGAGDSGAVERDIGIRNHDRGTDATPILDAGAITARHTVDDVHPAGDGGSGIATFTFATGSVGATYAFDIYPNGAPPGNKFQSATVNY